MSASATQGGHK